MTTSSPNKILYAMIAKYRDVNLMDANVLVISEYLLFSYFEDEIDERSGNLYLYDMEVIFTPFNGIAIYNIDTYDKRKAKQLAQEPLPDITPYFQETLEEKIVIQKRWLQHLFSKLDKETVELDEDGNHNLTIDTIFESVKKVEIITNGFIAQNNIAQNKLLPATNVNTVILVKEDSVNSVRDALIAKNRSVPHYKAIDLRKVIVCKINERPKLLRGRTVGAVFIYKGRYILTTELYNTLTATLVSVNSCMEDNLEYPEWFGKISVIKDADISLFRSA